MTTLIQNFLRDETGAAAAEYALILAIVGAGIAGAAFYLGGAISTSIKGTADDIKGCTSGSTAPGAVC
jgi:pilus assembly protein Flp/PilA